MKSFRVFLVFVLIYFALFGILAGSGQTIHLPELINPNSISIHKGNIYISDGVLIRKYSLDDFKSKLKFGKEGNGPREFRLHPNINRGGLAIYFKNDRIIVNSILKLSRFTTDGRYLDEIKTTRTSGNFKPLGENYVGTGSMQDSNGIEYSAVNIYDSGLKKVKDLHRMEIWNERKSLDPISFTQFPVFHVSEEKIFVHEKNGKGNILVFDMDGNMISTISHQFRKLKVKESDISKYETYFKTSIGYKGFLESYRKIIKFPEYFPVIRNFHIDKDKIFLATFQESSGMRLCYVFNTAGKFLKKINLYIPEISPIRLYPYTTYKNKLYTLVEDSDSDDWVLHVNEIK